MIFRSFSLFFVLMFIMQSYSIRGQNISELMKNDLEKIIAEKKLENAYEAICKLRETYPDSGKTILSSVLNLGINEFQKGDRRNAIEFLEKVKPLFGSQIGIYRVLGQLYWYNFDRSKCIENFQKTIHLDPKDKTAGKYLDLLLFVPDDFDVPELMKTKNMLILPIKVEHAELDYKAVVGSVDHLKGVFGPDDDWPQKELTLEKDKQALQNHENEHQKRSAFTYTVMNHQQTECLGCIYIMPIHSKDYSSQVFLWVTKEAFDKGYDAELFSSVKEWISKDWPFKKVVYPGRDMKWDEYNQLKEEYKSNSD